MVVSLGDISPWVACGMSRPHPPPEGNRESVHEVASLPYPLVGSALVGAYILVAYHGRFLPQFPPLLTVACGHRQWWEWREAPLRGAKLAARSMFCTS